MNGFSILVGILSVVFLLYAGVPGKEQFILLAYYALLLAILVEVGCIHDTLKENNENPI